MNKIISAFGGRKFFYCWYWGMIATGLLMHKDISSIEWLLVIGYTFGGSAIANSMEAIQTIKAKTTATIVTGEPQDLKPEDRQGT